MEKDFSRATDVKTASALIFTGEGVLHGIMVSTDGTNTPTVEVFDNTAGSGTPLTPAWVVATGATDKMRFLSFPQPVRFRIGLYVKITLGAGAMSYVVYFNN